LILALVGGEWSASRPGRFTPGINWLEGWVDPRTGLDDVEKRKLLTLAGLELRPFGRPARSQELYRLRYPKSMLGYKIKYSYYPKLVSMLISNRISTAELILQTGMPVYDNLERMEEMNVT
jgi:hypothetical protein